MNSYYGGSGHASPAREIIELELMEMFHWSLDQINSMPYKKLQKIFIIQRQRSATIKMKERAAQFRASGGITGR